MLNPKNAPEAKPVKIRIMSGGEEHSSLDSLRQNFNLKDIENLLDGRLVNWLYKIGENDLAEKVDNLPSDKASIIKDDFQLQLIRIFFDDIPASTLKEIAKHWESAPLYKKNAYYLYERLMYTEPEIALKLYEEDAVGFDDWQRLFTKFIECEENTNPQIFFIIGKMLLEQGSYVEGEKLIKQAADKGLKDAILYVKKEEERRKKEEVKRKEEERKRIATEKFENEMKRKKLRYIIKKWLDEDVSLEAFISAAESLPQYLVNEKAFLIILKEIIKTFWHHYEYCKKIFEKYPSLDPADTLYREKAFILIICKKYTTKDIKKDEAINEVIREYSLDKKRLMTYPPYRVLKECVQKTDGKYYPKNDLKDNYGLKKNEIENLLCNLCDLYCSDVDKIIKIIVTHLIDFRES